MVVVEVAKDASDLDGWLII